MARLVRLLLALLIAGALVGAPAVQAAATVPCSTTIAGATNPLHASGYDQNSVPCNDKMPSCVDMLGCGPGVSLPAHTAPTVSLLTWTRAAYFPAADLLDGLSVEPDLGPPISI